QPGQPIASIRLGDARDLPWEDASADVVLLMGPLYHLTSRDDRVQALGEAHRVLREGGLIAAAAVSRYSPLFDGLVRGFLDDPEFAKIVDRDLRDGQHRNTTGKLDYFTTAYMHHPDELAAEATGAGFRDVAVYSVEGPAWAVRDLEERWANPDRRKQLMELLRKVELEPSLAGASSHLLAIGRR
ncbi:MAG: class I SAM-dependent methyltransferase, partial [bacterium]|nr:class I SAM-dependent methyltransferase [bacterium]